MLFKYIVIRSPVSLLPIFNTHTQPHKNNY